MDKKSGLAGQMDDANKGKSTPRKGGPRRVAPKKPKVEQKVEHKKEPKVIAVHTLGDKETWTHLALRYYGDMSEPYWRYLYEFNKEMVGDNYKRIWGGMEIRIPELPDHLKKEDK
jgi:nucleoid-associated protein YgaU